MSSRRSSSSSSAININGAVEAKPNVEQSPNTSPARSCVSSEDGLKYSSSPETTSMVLVGCPRCLMYVMLSDVDPKCPKCQSTVLLDIQPHYTDDFDDDDDNNRNNNNNNNFNFNNNNNNFNNDVDMD